MFLKTNNTSLVNDTKVKLQTKTNRALPAGQADELQNSDQANPVHSLMWICANQSKHMQTQKCLGDTSLFPN